MNNIGTYIKRARYAILLILFGFSSAYLMVTNRGEFETLTITVQAIIVLLIAGIGFLLVWKDRQID